MCVCVCVLRANFADLALVKVVDDGVVERLFELPLGLWTVGLKLRAAHLIQPLRRRSRRHRAKKIGLVLFFLFCHVDSETFFLPSFIIVLSKRKGSENSEIGLPLLSCIKFLAPNQSVQQINQNNAHLSYS